MSKVCINYFVSILVFCSFAASGGQSYLILSYLMSETEKQRVWKAI